MKNPKWTRKADMPTGRSHPSTSVVNGKIYAIGGIIGMEAASTVEEYNPMTDTWTEKADMPTPRTYLSTSAVNGKIYAIGGTNAAAMGFPVIAFSLVEAYDTGFIPPKIVEVKGKLVMSWGKIKDGSK